MKNQVTYTYGQWLKHLKKFKEQLETQDIVENEDIIIAGLFSGTALDGSDFSITFPEFRKLAAAAFRHTKVDHGNTINDGWESSFFKRLWGQMRHTRNEKIKLLRKKQIEQIDYLLKQASSQTEDQSL